MNHPVRQKIKFLSKSIDSTTIGENKMFYGKKFLYAKRIKRKQRELSRKEKGSKNYYKCKKRTSNTSQ